MDVSNGTVAFAGRTQWFIFWIGGVGLQMTDAATRHFVVVCHMWLCRGESVEGDFNYNEIVLLFFGVQGVSFRGKLFDTVRVLNELYECQIFV